MYYVFKRIVKRYARSYHFKKLLEENGKMYGYEICQKVKDISDGKILIKDGSLYPALHKLLKDGILTTEEVNIGKRVGKYYTLTPKGKGETENSGERIGRFHGDAK